jgi:protein involved in polysaccharide export with SLBB domain
MLPPVAFTQQDEVLRSILEEGIRAQRAKEERKTTEEWESNLEWRTFVCPTCQREFQVSISEQDQELQRGLREITCPYDDTKFIPRQIAMREALKEEPRYVTIISPYEKKQFKTKLDIEGIAAGTVIVDPYSGKKFRYVPEVVKPQEEWKEISSPGDGRKFKIRVFAQDKLSEVASPYDGKKFSPDWQYLSEKDRLSDIERMFSREIPLAVSKAIRQFGYDLFPQEPEIKKIGEEKTEKVEEEEGVSKKEGVGRGLSLLEERLAEKGIKSQFEEGLYAPLTTVPVSDDYVLGPGDKLVINLWGNIQQTFDLDIDGEGKVILPQAGPLYLWGIKFAEAKKLIQENLSKYFTNFQINVSMGKLRSIKIFILGDAKKPGAYTASSLSTVFSALYQAGGPNKIGSLRKIKLTRANKTEEGIDFYSYLLEGDRSQDFKLDTGDTIFIPPIGSVVGIAGNVKRPAIYELKNNINLNELLEMAGGISAVGYMQRIQVERIKDHQRKIVFDLEFENMQALGNSASNAILQDGDLILISAVTPIRHNYITISGNITRPGDYELKPNMKLKDLVDEAEGILPGTYLERAELSRFRDDKTREILPVNLSALLNNAEAENIELKEWDRFNVFTKSEVIPTFFVKIEGAVYKPGEYELTDNMRLSDLIFRAGGLKKTASLGNAELYRYVLGEEPKVVLIDLAYVFDPRTKENDLFLQEGDQLFIREDAKWLSCRKVTLSGEICYPGVYIASPNERLSSLIKRAGGFTDKAFLTGAIFTRRSVEKYQRQMIRRFIDAEQEAMLKEESSLAMNVSASLSEARREIIKYRQRQLEALESTSLIGRIVIKIDALDKFANSQNDITLEDGDALVIPQIPSSVQVIGNVCAPNAVNYVEGKGLEYYINRVGGLTKNADKNGIFIIKPSGEAASRFTSARKIDRGDVIIVPEVFKYKTPIGLIFKDAFSFTSQLVVTVLALSAVN